MALTIEGVWKDKSLILRLKRSLSDGMARIFGHTHGGHYDKNLRSHLPYDGGVPREVMESDLEQTGFSSIKFQDIKFIQEIQKQQQPWYLKFAPGRSYYIIAATKKD